MHCQKDTCEKIVNKGGNYAFGVKGNQSGLFEDIKLFLTDPVNLEDTKTFETIEKNGGRIEKRICVSSDHVEWLPDLPLWSGLRTIFSITRITTTKEKTTEETGFYISSLPNEPENLLSVVRSHWKIESMHWSLDVIWHEDGCGILSDNGHKTLNAFRKLALFGHKNYVARLTKKCSVKSNVLSALLDDEVAFGVMLSL
jgi:predicted transposase YbfD/YdcC